MTTLDPSLVDRTAPRRSCIECDSEQLTRDATGSYVCAACGAYRPRALIIDPAIAWWIASDGEYWHDTAGIFVRNPARHFLLFRRTRFPFGLTVPAGHINAGEAPALAARRELREETSIQAEALRPLGGVDVIGDSCRRGADAHHWHCYLTDTSGDEEIIINDEGVAPVWMSLLEICGSADLTFAVAFLIERYASDLRSASS